jgi:hypothetical protein
MYDFFYFIVFFFFYISNSEIPPSALGKGNTLPHYSLGDLGLIPRPKQNIPTFLERTQTLSTTTRLGGLRKVLTRSVAVQTVSAPKARDWHFRSCFLFVCLFVCFCVCVCVFFSCFTVHVLVCDVIDDLNIFYLFSFQAMFYADQLLSRQPAGAKDTIMTEMHQQTARPLGPIKPLVASVQ